MKTLLFALFIAFGACAQANAQNKPEPNWVVVSSGDKSTYAFDKTSLKRNGDIVSSWIKTTEEGKDGHTLDLTEMNCKTDQMRILSSTIYYKNGTTYSPKLKQEWFYVVRASIGETLLGYACKNAPKESFLDKIFSK